jgi:hypothetical protein
MSELVQSAGSNANTSNANTANTTAMTSTEIPGYRLPESATLAQCAKLAIVEDKPIMLDYWTNSIEKKPSLASERTRRNCW